MVKEKVDIKMILIGALIIIVIYKLTDKGKKKRNEKYSCSNASRNATIANTQKTEGYNSNSAYTGQTKCWENEYGLY